MVGFSEALVCTVIDFLNAPLPLPLKVTDNSVDFPGRIGSCEYFRLVHPHEALALVINKG
jgi:hypothetical protein